MDSSTPVPADLNPLADLQEKLIAEVEDAIHGVIEGEKEFAAYVPSDARLPLYDEDLYNYGMSEGIDFIYEHYIKSLEAHEIALMLLGPLAVGAEDTRAFITSRIIKDIIEHFISDKKASKKLLADLLSIPFLTNRHKDKMATIRSSTLYKDLFTEAGRNLTWHDLLSSPFRDRVLKSKRLDSDQPLESIQRLLAERLFGSDWLSDLVDAKITEEDRAIHREETEASEKIEREWRDLLNPPES